jgi:tetratricopeptide (TPR) repeat protein
MDDEYVAFNNPQIQGGIKNIPDIFKTTYAIDKKASYEYRPIVKVTYAIEHEIFGINPHISHFINILIYVFCSCLLFYVLLKLLPGYHYVFSLSVVLIFLVHPIHSEVVMSLKNRDGMLSFIGCLFSLQFYLRYFAGKGIWNILVGMLCVIFAIMSKKDFVPFFFIIPFTAWFFKTVNWKQILIVLVSFIPPLLAFRASAKTVINETVRELMLWENPLFIDSTLAERIPQGFYCIYFYLKMFLIPHPLISYYGYDQVPIVGWSHPVVWIMIVFLGVVLFFVMKHLKQKPIWVYGIIYFLVTISMFTNILRPVVGIVAERFAFIPSVGLCLLAVYGLVKYFRVPLNNPSLKLKSMNTGFWTVMILVLVVYGGKTFSRNPAWKDAYTLYKTDAETATESAHTHSLLAAAALSKARTEPRLSVKDKRDLVLEAEEHYKEAIRIIPDYTSAHNNIGMMYYSYMKNNEKAMYHLRKAIQLDSAYVEAYFNLATCYSAMRDFATAEKYFLKTLELDPAFVNSYLSLSNIYAANKQFDKILKLNQNAIDKGIKTDIIYINVGNVHFMNGDTLKALPYLEKAIEFNWNNKGVNSFLTNYYRGKGDNQKADMYLRLLSKSTPGP